MKSQHWIKAEIGMNVGLLKSKCDEQPDRIRLSQVRWVCRIDELAAYTAWDYAYDDGGRVVTDHEWKSLEASK